VEPPADRLFEELIPVIRVAGYQFIGDLKGNIGWPWIEIGTEIKDLYPLLPVEFPNQSAVNHLLWKIPLHEKFPFRNGSTGPLRYAEGIFGGKAKVYILLCVSRIHLLKVRQMVAQ
jgi:hypothetical protein